MAARWALVTRLAPGRDELGYWYWAWHGLDASYSLITVGAVRLSTAILGDGAVAMRIPGFLASLGALALLIRWAVRLGASRGQAIWIGVAFAASLWQTYVGSVIHPDAFLTFFLILFAERVTAAGADAAPRGPAPDSPAPDSPGRTGAILGAGIAAAGVALSKLTGAILLPVAILFLWRQRRTAPRASAASAAIVLGAGALLWFHRDPQVLAGVREFGRFAGDAAGISRAGATVLESAALGGPALWWLGIAGELALLRPSGTWIPAGVDRVVLAATGGVFLVMHAAFAVLGQVKGNWWLPPLTVFLPIGWLALARRESWLKGAALVSATASLLLALQCALPGSAARWQSISESGLLAQLDSSYAVHAGEREADVSPTQSWSGRFTEFTAEAAPVDRPAGPGPLPLLVSNDYGLAFAVAHHWGRDAEVLLPWDPIYARTCGGSPSPGDHLVFISRNWPHPPERFSRSFHEANELKTDEAKNDRSLVVLYCQHWSPDQDSAWTH